MSDTISDPVVGLPDSLLAPLLDTAGEALKRLEPDQVPVPVRALKSFDARGLTRGAARHQLLRAVELDAAFRDVVVQRFLERSEVVTVLDAWDPAQTLARVADAAQREDLPLLASALWAARPAGWAFGLGAVCGALAGSRRAKEEDDDLEALRARGATLDEARRRADAARVAAEEEVERLERELREERRSRRAREIDAERQVDAARRQAQELEESLAEARASTERAETRRHHAAQRSRELESELRAVRAELGRVEQALAEARHALERAPAPGTGLRHADLQALVDAAELARRLADGLGGVARRARGLGPRSSTPAPPEGPRAGARRRRAGVGVPPGLAADAPEAVNAVLRTPGLVVVVDGYNVSMHAWPTAPPADQRDRLADLLAGLHSRFRCAVTLVFDGADVGPVRPLRRPGVHVVFSAPDEEADVVVVREVTALPLDRPVLVVSSDRWVREHAEAEGARVATSSALLAALRA